MAWPANGVELGLDNLKTYNIDLDALLELEENKKKWQEKQEKLLG